MELLPWRQSAPTATENKSSRPHTTALQIFKQAMFEKALVLVLSWLTGYSFLQILFLFCTGSLWPKHQTSQIRSMGDRD